ncbi:hypothetical protein [Nonomuraea jabiensis]|uniref:Uncharacterized protein n=1 Tax=Nonomuraea jabiensis TaxID=882448 RepID=A0A7W9GGJ1_9ACTN|nr:hypothetical protein [Nonomuraea jabiensis]MBB5783390.1 hypothetical protein [Nonomuraea jabiensis]
MMLLLILFGWSEVVLSGLCGGGTCADGWYVDLLKATLVLPPFAALLFACSCLFSRRGMVGRKFQVQVLAFSVVVIVWVVALEMLRYVEDLARF